MKNITNLTIQDMKKLNSFAFLKSMVGTMILCLVFVIIGILFLVMNIGDASAQYGTILICVGVLLVPVSYIVAIIGQDRQLKKHNFSDGFTYEYIFSKDGFQVHAMSTNLDSKTSVTYKELIRVSERQDCLYLFIDKQKAYIVKYNGFESENDRIRLLTLINNK